VQSYFVRQLPGRLIGAASRAEQEQVGLFLTDFLIPEEFRGLIAAGKQLTLVLDAGTACYPWEMAALRGHHHTRLFGTDLTVTRQFSTLLSAAPGVAPPLNQTLKVLIIADPAPGTLALPGARAEGLAVAEVFKQAQAVWGKKLDLRVTVRVGPYTERPSLRERLDALRGDGSVIRSAAACDPFELLMLLVEDQYDVVHYSGHGVFEDGGRMGWVFDKGCVLTAQEIFRVRQVPRLVFANACLSAVTRDDHQTQQRHQVGLAQAFFARGIQNYIGTGWAVDDEPARRFAVRFYQQTLGRPVATAPPATLGASLAAARQCLLDQCLLDQGGPSSTWGAYQHYGRANDKLLPWPNVNAGDDDN